jgi:hypothetical protein
VIKMMMELDEDPNEALAVILGQARGDRAYAVICLADAIRHGDYPACWRNSHDTHDSHRRRAAIQDVTAMGTLQPPTR